MTGTVHAGCVAVDGRGLLISGASGSGKSSLALRMLALGATLVADDRCRLESRDGLLWASCPEPIRGLIEARYLGILNLQSLPEARIVAEVNLDQVETMRLPLPRHSIRCGVSVPLLLKSPGPEFAAALILYLRSKRLN